MMATPTPPGRTMHGWVAWHARRRPDAPAISSRTARLSYGELDERTRRLAARFAADGLGDGDRVLVALPNLVASVVASLAAGTAGGTSVEVSRGWSPAMLAEVVRRTRPRQVVIWERDARLWQDLLQGHAVQRVWLVGHGSAGSAPQLSDHATSHLGEDGSVTDPGSMEELPELSDTDPDAVALILFTSGSTGRPTGVIQTVGNIDANTRSIVDYLGLTSDDRAFLTLPLAYCYGRSVLQTHLHVGGSVYLENGFAFPRVALETLAAEGATGFAGVPLTFEIIRRQVDLGTLARPTLRYVTQAGGQMSAETTAWLRTALAPARLFVMYGQTEATARLTYLPPERADGKPGSIGIPIPGVEIRIVDGEGREVPDGTVGELEARGPNVTPGYLDDPEATAAILRNGWLRTGDLAYRDPEGYLFHRGRAKEILKIGGHRVSPVEIEEIFASHPEVLEVAVVGVPDSLMGEVPVAVVVYRSALDPGDDAMRGWARERMPSWMVPVRFLTLERLPRNEAGKLLRSELRTLVASSG